MQPPFPTIPTDNLYKFLAISGLVILLICSIYPALITARVSTSAAEVVATRKLLDYQAETLKEEVARIESDLAQAKKAKLVTNERLDALEERNERARAGLEDAKRRIIDFEKQAKVALAEGNALKAQMDLMMPATVIGGGLFGLGFFLWYVNVQRHADTIIRNQAKASEATPIPAVVKSPATSDATKNPKVAPEVSGGAPSGK